MSLYFGIVAVFLCIWESHGQEACLTPSRTQSTCVNINECPPLLELLKDRTRPLAPETLDLLSKSRCGFDGRTPKVCCPPTTTTPVITPSIAQEATAGPPPDVSNHPKLGFINDPACGPITESRIFGGNKTSVVEFPWMVLIAYKVGNRSPEFKCGGSLISKRYVLTAAHCVTGLSSGNRLFGVRIGEHDLSTERDCDKEKGVETVCAEPYQDITIQSVHVHERYQSPDKFKNDIALIRMNQEVDFRPINVKPICLPVGTARTFTYRRATVTGWGTTETGSTSQDLLQAKVPIVPTADCTRTYKPLKVDIWYKQLCAGGTNRTDSCAGDSGGPLQSPAAINNQPKYVQYGVVSFGPRDCGIEGLPGVYTQVVYYMDWILDTMTQ